MPSPFGRDPHAAGARLEQRLELLQLVDRVVRAGRQQVVARVAATGDPDRAHVRVERRAHVQRRVADQDRVGSVAAAGAPARDAHQLRALAPIGPEAALAGGEELAEPAQAELAARYRLEVAGNESEVVPLVAQ